MPPGPTRLACDDHATNCSAGMTKAHAARWRTPRWQSTRARPGQRDRLDPATATTLLVARPAPQPPLPQDDDRGHHEHGAGQLGRGTAFEHAVPHLFDADRDRGDVEVLDRGEVGQCLHGDQRRPGGQGRAGERQQHAPGRRRRRQAQRAGGVVGRGRLLAERGTGLQVDVGIQRQREHDDGHPHRTRVEQGAVGTRQATQDATAPGRAHRAGRWRRIPARRRAWPMATRASTTGCGSPGKRWTAVSQARPPPMTRVRDDDADHQDERGHDHLEQAGLPQQSPDIGRRRQQRQQHAGQRCDDRRGHHGGSPAPGPAHAASTRRRRCRPPRGARARRRRRVLLARCARSVALTGSPTRPATRRRHGCGSRIRSR